MRCPSCNKFATYDTGAEPEINIDDPEVTVPEPDPEDPIVLSVSVQIMGTARIVLTSECCGDELKEATFDIDESFSLKRGKDCTCDLSELTAELQDSELTERRQATTIRQKKDGTVVTTPIPSRFQKQFYGVSLTILLSCDCGKTSDTFWYANEEQASSMDELT